MNKLTNNDNLKFKIREVCTRQQSKVYYDKKYTFSFVFSSIIDYLINDKYELTEKQIHILENSFTYFNKTCMSIISQTMVFHLNKMYKNQEIYKNFNSFYENFIDEFIFNGDFRFDFFDIYPELFKLLFEFFNDQIKCFLSIENIIKNKEKDFKSKFCVDIDDLVNIDMSMGDRHLNGKSTSLISIGGKDFFIKWKSNESESSFLKFYKYFIKSTSDQTVDIDINYISGCNYYIQEYIHQKESDDSTKLYYNVGVFLFVAYLLGMTDLHEENIIVTNNNVIAIDCETIFNYFDINSTYGYDLGKSVYSTALLPSNSISGAVLSGFNSNQNQYLYVDEFKIIINDNEIVMNNLNKVCLNEKKNKPLGLIKVNYYDHKQLIKEGFKDSYTKYFKYKDEIILDIKKEFDNITHRILHKNTYDYSAFLWRSYHPYLMFDCDRRYNFFKELSIFNSFEIDELYSNLIPFFEEKLNIDSIFFDKFSYDDLKIQLKLIDEALDLDKRRNVKSIKNNNIKPDCSLEKFIKDYKEFLLERSFIFDDINSWVDVVETGNLKYKNLDISIMPKTIYCGKSGVYLFLIEYYKKYPNEYEENLIIEQIKIILQDIEYEIKKYPKIQNGFYDGASGILYLVYIANERYKICEVEKIVNLFNILVQNIRNDINYDLLGGTSGLLGVLHFIYNDTSNNEMKILLKTLISKTTNYLLETYKRDENMCGWVSPQEDSSVVCLGYAHGIAGIIPQLYKSYKITKDLKIMLVINECVDFLIQTYNKDKSTWSSKNNDDNYYYNWCHGTPGIIQSFSMLYDYGYNRMGMKKMIQDNLKVILSNKKDSICLCHGSYGNYSIGAFCSKTIGNNNMHNIFKTLIDSEMKNLCELHSFELFNKGFMTGLSGIAYWALKDNNYNPMV